MSAVLNQVKHKTGLGQQPTKQGHQTWGKLLKFTALLSALLCMHSPIQLTKREVKKYFFVHLRA